MRLNRKFAGGAVGVALLAGAGGAWAGSSGGSSSSTGRDAFLNDVAGRLDVTPEKLKGALQGAFEDQLDADVKAGRLTQEQADRIKKDVKEHGGAPFGPVPGPPPGPGFGIGGRFHAGPPPLAGQVPPGAPPPGAPPFAGPPPPGTRHVEAGPFHAGFDAAAKYLGLSDAQLFRRLRSGKSLAQIASAQGRDVAGLKSAIEAGVKDELDKAVADKRLTQQQEKDILGGLHDRIDELVNRSGRDRPPRPPRWRRGPHW
jgi:hypothetical protein